MFANTQNIVCSRPAAVQASSIHVLILDNIERKKTFKQPINQTRLQYANHATTPIETWLTFIIKRFSLSTRWCCTAVTFGVLQYRRRGHPRIRLVSLTWCVHVDWTTDTSIIRRACAYWLAPKIWAFPARRSFMRSMNWWSASLTSTGASF